MHRPRPSTIALLAPVVFVLVAVLAACSGGDSSDSASDASASAEGGAVGAGGAAEAAVGPADIPEQAEPVDAERRVVYTGRLRIRVDDPVAEAAGAVEAVETAGGTLASQDEDADDEVEVVVRVPSERFRAVFDQLGRAGTVLERSVGTEDVTDQVVDLQSRLDNARASVERLRGLFADAADVNQVVAVETALTEREAEVESLAGQLQVLEDQADRSTITATFTRQGELEVDDDIPGFLQGLRNGWVALRNVLAVGVTVLGFLLPFLLVSLPIALAAAWVLRRRRRRPVAPTAAASADQSRAGPPAPPAPRWDQAPG